MRRIAILTIIGFTLFAVGCQHGGQKNIQKNSFNLNVTIDPVALESLDSLTR
jgi:hypothetical protein